MARLPHSRHRTRGWHFAKGDSERAEQLQEQEKEKPGLESAFGGTSLPPELHARPHLLSRVGAAPSVMTCFKAVPSQGPHRCSRCRGRVSGALALLCPSQWSSQGNTLRPRPCGAPSRAVGVSSEFRDQRPHCTSTLTPKHVLQAQPPVPGPCPIGVLAALGYRAPVCPLLSLSWPLVGCQDTLGHLFPQSQSHSHVPWHPEPRGDPGHVPSLSCRPPLHPHSATGPRGTANVQAWTLGSMALSAGLNPGPALESEL